MLALETGDFDGARSYLAAARTHLERAEGELGVRVARVRFCQAKLAMAEGELDHARVELDAVREVFERELGPAHEETGNYGHRFDRL